MFNADSALNGGETLAFSSAGGAASAASGCIVVPDAHLLFNGEFKRVGASDLKIVGDDGTSFFIEDYFADGQRASLMSPEGALLTANIVSALAGPLAPGQTAQAGAQAPGQPAIGRVEAVSGSATVIRNGVTVTLSVGDTVRKGDVVQTAGASAVAIVLADGSTFSLSANARMVLDDFVFTAGGSNNSALISLVQGTFSFVAGQVAKTGDMRVETPVATMGIRGTAVLVEISANDGRTRFSVMVEPDGTTGSYNLYNKTTGTLIATVNNSSVGWVLSPAGPSQVIAQQEPKTPAQLQQELSIIQQIFTIFNNYQQNPFTPQNDQRGQTDPNVQTTGSTGTGGLPDANTGGGGPTETGTTPSVITVTLTPIVPSGPNIVDSVDPLTNGPGDPGPPTLPGIVPQIESFTIINGSGIITGTAGIDHIFGSSGRDIITALAGDDMVFAGGGDDTVIAGHGEGDDIYDGGSGFDEIDFSSAAGGVLFNLNVSTVGGVKISTADGLQTGHDTFANFEQVIAGNGNDIFVLHDATSWTIDAGGGIDIVRLANGVDLFGPIEGPHITNFEIADMATDTGQNIVEFDIGDFDDFGNAMPFRVLGGQNDVILLTNNWNLGGSWQQIADNILADGVFVDGLTDGVRFDVYQGMIGDQTFTVYVQDGVVIDTPPDIVWEPTVAVTPVDTPLFVNGMSFEDTTEDADAIFTVTVQVMHGSLGFGAAFDGASGITIIDGNGLQDGTLSFSGTRGDIMAVLHGDAPAGHNGFVYTPASHYSGPSQLVFTVTDSNGLTSSSTLDIIVDTPPDIVAGPPSSTLVEDGVLTSTVQLSLSDADGDPVNYDLSGWTFSGQPGIWQTSSGLDYGNVFLNTLTGQLTYNLDNSAAQVQALGGGELVTDTVTVVVTDPHGVTDTVDVTFQIEGAADIGAQNDTASMSENAVTFIDVLANDEGPGRTLTSLGTVTMTGPGGVTLGNPVIVIENGQIRITPGTAFDALAQGETATIVIPYTMQIAGGETFTATATVTVTGTNDAPQFSVLPEGFESIGSVTPTTFGGVDALGLSTAGQSVASVAQLESFLGLSAGTLASISGQDIEPGSNPRLNPTEGSAIAFDLVLEEGESVSFSWNFASTEYQPYNDFAFISFAPSSGDKLADIYDIGDASPGGSHSSGWQTYTFTAGDSGTHTLGIGVVDTGDTAVESFLYISGFSGLGFLRTTTEDGEVQVFNLLNGAFDPDTNDNDDLTATNVVATGHDQNGHAVNVLGAVTVSGNEVSIDPNFFNALNAGQTVTVVVNYDLSDGHTTTHNSATLVVTGVNDFQPGAGLILDTSMAAIASVEPAAPDPQAAAADVFQAALDDLNRLLQQDEIAAAPDRSAASTDFLVFGKDIADLRLGPSGPDHGTALPAGGDMLAFAPQSEPIALIPCDKPNAPADPGSDGSQPAFRLSIDLWMDAALSLDPVVPPYPGPSNYMLT